MTDKELADALDARDRLIARGYKRVKCDRCNGTGLFEDFRGKEHICPFCNSSGEVWQAPDDEP